MDGLSPFCGEVVAVFVGVRGGLFFCLCSVGVWQAFSRLGFWRAGVAVAGFVGRFWMGYGRVMTVHRSVRL